MLENEENVASDTISDQPTAWRNIHIFGYGQSQLIGRDLNKKVLNTALSAINPFLQSLSTGMGDLFTINIANKNFVSLVPKKAGGEVKHFNWDEIDTSLVDNLANEILSLQ